MNTKLILSLGGMEFVKKMKIKQRVYQFKNDCNFAHHRIYATRTVETAYVA